MRRAKEKWKKIVFPDGFVAKATYEVSNYGRVRNILKDKSFRIKQFKVLNKNVVYKFVFPENDEGKRLVLHQKASHLVAKAFCKEYFPGCFVVHKNYNRLDNYFGNLLCLNEHYGRSHLAKGRKKNTPQEFVFAEESYDTTSSDLDTHKVESDNEFFKKIPHFPDYEVNRLGVVRRRTPPFKGRIIKQRLHPDGLLMMDLRDGLNKRRTAYAHKLVAEMWCVNIDPAMYRKVVHIDGNQQNNVADNLEWVSTSDKLRGEFERGKRDNFKSWKTRKAKYGNGFKEKK